MRGLKRAEFTADRRDQGCGSPLRPAKQKLPRVIYDDHFATFTEMTGQQASWPPPEERHGLRCLGLVPGISCESFFKTLSACY
ncbi:hypothetical protein J2W51_003810 [Tardiphaga robiniae]|nr:hypothetical protein [Tardiphaga robiniae]